MARTHPASQRQLTIGGGALAVLGVGATVARRRRRRAIAESPAADV